MSDSQALKQEILRLTREYSRQVHSSFRPALDPQRQPWEVGATIPYAGRVFTEDEVEAAVSATLDFWLTLGSEGAAMERELASFLGVRHSLLVNSGSSANLVAMASLTSAKLPDLRRIKPGDEVITVAAGFPTTVAPIVQVGAVPVFIDADPITGNARCDQLEAAYSPGKTKAVMMAHALGNPFDLATTLAFCQKHDLWLVEDNCDALGCSYSMPRELAESLGFKDNSPGLDEGPDRVARWTGTWGDISTQSFYPPHHLTM
jgi:CDP-6-deoxy-D-xylo-4-hexulose-3-dehydrase